MGSPATNTTFELERDEIRRRLGDPSLKLLDVLPREAFAESHIPHSLNIPVAEIRDRARAELPDPSAEIGVYCGGPT